MHLEAKFRGAPLHDAKERLQSYRVGQHLCIFHPWCAAYMSSHQWVHSIFWSTTCKWLNRGAYTHLTQHERERQTLKCKPSSLVWTPSAQKHSRPWRFLLSQQVLLKVVDGGFLAIVPRLRIFLHKRVWSGLAKRIASWHANVLIPVKHSTSPLNRSRDDDLSGERVYGWSDREQGTNQVATQAVRHRPFYAN